MVKPFEPELRRQLSRELLAGGRSVPRTDHGHDRAFGKLEPALGVEQGRRRIDMGERRRIAPFPHGDERGADVCSSSELSLGFGFAVDPDRVRASATARQRRERVERGLGAAELVD